MMRRLLAYSIWLATHVVAGFEAQAAGPSFASGSLNCCGTRIGCPLEAQVIPALRHLDDAYSSGFGANGAASRASRLARQAARRARTDLARRELGRAQGELSEFHRDESSEHLAAAGRHLAKALRYEQRAHQPRPLFVDRRGGLHFFSGCVDCSRYGRTWKHAGGMNQLLKAPAPLTQRETGRYRRGRNLHTISFADLFEHSNAEQVGEDFHFAFDDSGHAVSVESLFRRDAALDRARPWGARF